MPRWARVYLPREDFARFGIDTHADTNGSAPASLRPVMEFEAHARANTIAPRRNCCR